jgi:hypothetical protein
LKEGGRCPNSETILISIVDNSFALTSSLKWFNMIVLKLMFNSTVSSFVPWRTKSFRILMSHWKSIHLI